MAEGQNVCSENKEIRETMRQMRVVNKGIRKVDAKSARDRTRRIYK